MPKRVHRESDRCYESFVFRERKLFFVVIVESFQVAPREAGLDIARADAIWLVGRMLDVIVGVGGAQDLKRRGRY